MASSYIDRKPVKSLSVPIIALIALIGTSLLIVTMNLTTAQEQTAPGSILKLSRASIPIDIPLVKGYENGNEIFTIATDVSDMKTQRGVKLMYLRMELKATVL
jgi:hypothetical protein